ncbi:MAG: nucleoside hydrolase [Clostridia bacterium]|nr:nucleoside hydrolase [Clostridia bacterium]
MKKKIPVILCVDTGIDDAVGIALATKLKEIDIKLIVCEQGNSNIDNITKNTLGVLDTIFAPNIPVVKGHPPKINRFIFNAHGKNGLAGYVFDESDRTFVDVEAHEAIYNVLCENQDTVIIILGPQTSVARTLTLHEDAKEKIKKLVIMAGSINEPLDTTNPYSEFNIASDPESAEIVLSSGIDILMVPSEMGRIAVLDYYDIYRTKNTNHTGAFIEKLYRKYKHRLVKKGVATCDSTTIAAFVRPDIYEIKPTYAFVKYFDSINSGICLFDFNKQPNINICTNIDVKKFKHFYFKTLKKLP